MLAVAEGERRDMLRYRDGEAAAGAGVVPSRGLRSPFAFVGGGEVLLLSQVVVHGWWQDETILASRRMTGFVRKIFIGNP
jgi:hypothetical protein